MSDAADRRIAELERECATRRMEHADYLARTERDLANMTREILDLRKQVVERDVYEAQQLLPPEQAALIKHLATVERCIEEGREEFNGYDIEVRCIFCHRDDGEHSHDKACAWLTLQFDRKPAETMAMVEGWAWEENDRRDRERARAMTPREPLINNMMGLSEWLKNAWPIERVQDVPAGSALGAMRITPHPLVPPGHAYLISGLGEPERFAVSPTDMEPEDFAGYYYRPPANPATVTPDEAPQHPGLEGEPRRARGGEDVEEGVPPVDHRPPDGQR